MRYSSDMQDKRLERLAEIREKVETLIAQDDDDVRLLIELVDSIYEHGIVVRDTQLPFPTIELLFERFMRNTLVVEESSE